MQRNSRIGAITIKSNPIPVGWATHRLENNNTKEVLSLFWKFWDLCQASQSRYLAKELRIPRECDFEGQQDLIPWLPQDWGKQSGRAQSAVCTRTQEKGAGTPQETDQTCLLVLEGLLWSGGQEWLSTLAAAVLACEPWFEPSWRLPLTLPQSLWTPGLGHLKQLIGMGCNPTHLQTIRSKFNWARLGYSKTIFPTASPFHESLLDSSTRGQTEWARKTRIPRLPKWKPHHRKLIKMKRQRIMSEMKGQDKTPEKQLNEVETGSLQKKRIQNNNNEDDSGSWKKNGGKD